jgi:hypothetical protein
MDDRTEVEQGGSSVSRRGILGAFAAFAAVTTLVPDAWSAVLPMRKPGILGTLDGDGPLLGRKPDVTEVSARAPNLGRRARTLHLYNIHTGERVRDRKSVV